MQTTDTTTETRIAKIRDKAYSIAITWKMRYLAEHRAKGESRKKPAEITEQIEPQHDISNIRMIARDDEEKRQYYVTLRLRAAGDIIEAVKIAQDVHIGEMYWSESEKRHIRVDTRLSEVHQNPSTGVWLAVFRFYDEKNFMRWYEAQDQIDDILSAEQADLF